MQKQDILGHLGLTTQEAAIYLSLLQSGPALVSSIARSTGLHRPTVYQVLPRLIERELVTVFPRKKQKMYVAEAPEKLEHLFERFSEEFHDVLPELTRLHATGSTRPVIKFLEGKKGIMFVFTDIVRTLKRGETFYRYSSRKATTRGDAYLPPIYRELRDTKQLQRWVITNEPVSKEKRPRLERAVKLIPREFDLFEYDVTQLIYGHKVAFVDYNTQTALVIENPLVARFQKKIFELLFRML